MGILNVTPDSFSGDGLPNPLSAVDRGLQLIANGADILDIGGESTRPGAEPVPVVEELRRVVPVLKAVRERTSIPISVDTSRALVAEAALAAGADMVNDVWGFRRDPDLAEVVARYRALAVAMHYRAAPATSADVIGGFFDGVVYDDLMSEIAASLRGSLDILQTAGVPVEHVILDPGIGFGKTPEQNLELMRRLQELRALGRPLLIGPSRKSFIGMTLGLPPEDRVEGTAAAVALGIRGGADVVRAHDLPAMARVARMADAVVRGWTDAP
jgi:dihydropteroate synthase